MNKLQELEQRQRQIADEIQELREEQERPEIEKGTLVWCWDGDESRKQIAMYLGRKGVKHLCTSVKGEDDCFAIWHNVEPAYEYMGWTPVGTDVTECPEGIEDRQVEVTLASGKLGGWLKGSAEGRAFAGSVWAWGRGPNHRERIIAYRVVG